jgi:hypothetical protein
VYAFQHGLLNQLVAKGCVESRMKQSHGKENRMKRLLLGLLVFALAAPPVSAVTLMSLGWWEEGAVGSTHQRWEFTNGYVIQSGPGGYSAEPEDLINPVPSHVLATVTAQEWDSINGLFTSAAAIGVNLEVPNYEELNPFKEIWVDVGASSAPVGVTVSAVDGGVLSFEYLMLPGPGPGGFADFGVRIEPNPAIEKIQFIIQAPQGGEAVLDYVHVDTICIPDPGTIVLLGLGSLALLKKRR